MGSDYIEMFASGVLVSCAMSYAGLCIMFIDNVSRRYSATGPSIMISIYHRSMGLAIQSKEPISRLRINTVVYILVLIIIF
jgi:hypothetical protein